MSEATNNSEAAAAAAEEQALKEVEEGGVVVVNEGESGEQTLETVGSADNDETGNDDKEPAETPQNVEQDVAPAAPEYGSYEQFSLSAVDLISSSDAILKTIEGKTEISDDVINALSQKIAQLNTLLKTRFSEDDDQELYIKLHELKPRLIEAKVTRIKADYADLITKFSNFEGTPEEKVDQFSIALAKIVTKVPGKQEAVAAVFKRIIDKKGVPVDPNIDTFTDAYKKMEDEDEVVGSVEEILNNTYENYDDFKAAVEPQLQSGYELKTQIDELDTKINYLSNLDEELDGEQIQALEKNKTERSELVNQIKDLLYELSDLEKQKFEEDPEGLKESLSTLKNLLIDSIKDDNSSEDVEDTEESFEDDSPESNLRKFKKYAKMFGAGALLTGQSLKELTFDATNLDLGAFFSFMLNPTGRLTMGNLEGYLGENGEIPYHMFKEKFRNYKDVGIALVGTADKLKSTAGFTSWEDESRDNLDDIKPPNKASSTKTVSIMQSLNKNAFSGNDSDKNWNIFAKEFASNLFGKDELSLDEESIDFVKGLLKDEAKGLKEYWNIGEGNSEAEDGAETEQPEPTPVEDSQEVPESTNSDVTT